MVMFGGVPVRRRVTTADMTATEADSQVDPSAADPQAVLAAAGTRTHGLDLIDMLAAAAGARTERNLIVG
jgi:hypothetical protein